MNSENYPQRLLDLVDPPPFLFCKGNLSLLEESRSVALVGTRKPTPEGALKLAKAVAGFQTARAAIDMIRPVFSPGIESLNEGESWTSALE